MIRELDSLDDLTSGFVLNFFSSPPRSYGNTIHPFDCHHVRRMSLKFRKILADTVDELEIWIRNQGADLDPNTPHCANVKGRASHAPARRRKPIREKPKAISDTHRNVQSNLHARQKVLKTITGFKPLLAQWMKSTHPAQIRLYKYLEWMKAEIGELDDLPGDLFLHLDIAVESERKLLRRCDLENYLTPLFDKRCLDVSRLMLVSARKFVGDTSALTIGTIQPLILDDSWHSFQFAASTTAGLKEALHDSLKASGTELLPPGGVEMHLCWTMSGSLNWVAQWKSTGDAFGPILGYVNPQKPFHPLDDRITSLYLHRNIDDSLRKQISLGSWWRSAETAQLPT